LALRSGPPKVADEHAHTTLFPCLALHAAFDSLSSLGHSPEPPTKLGRVLVTGCAGRIGRAVTEHLVSNGVSVRGYDRQPRPPSLLPGVVRDGFEYVQGDLCDEAALRCAIEGCEAVCHLAAVPDDADFETVLCPVNIVGLNKVLEVCRGSGLRRLVVASSGKIFFHRNGDYPIRPDDPPKITCNYGATKLFLEGATEVFAKDAAGSPTVVLRFAWCPFAREDVEAMEGITLPGLGRDEYMSPGDCSRCVLAALSADLGSWRFAKLFCQSKPPPGRPARFDIAPTKKILGWEPQDTFPTGIGWIVQQKDYVKNPDLKKRVVPVETTKSSRRRLA